VLTEASVGGREKGLHQDGSDVRRPNQKNRKTRAKSDGGGNEKKKRKMKKLNPYQKHQTGVL